MSKINYKKPDFFYGKQDDIYSCNTRFTYTMSANKTGKTFSHCIWINEKALLGAKGTEYVWLSPYFRTSEVAFNLLQKLITNSTLYKHLEEIGSNNQFKFNNGKMRITYPNKNILNFLSGENIKSLYSQEYYAGVVDEASRLKEEAYDALLTNFFATEGPIKLISNPTIKNNWFWSKWNKIYNLENRTDGEATAFKLTALDAIDAGIMSQRIFDSAQKNYSPAIFKRDFLAEVPESDVSVFKANKVYDCILEEELGNSLNKARYVGIDLGFTTGQKSDYTVVVALDKLCRVVFYKRFKAETKELISKLKAYIGSLTAYIDGTGGGITIYNLLKAECPNLESYTFTNSSKTLCIENLAHYIHSDLVKYPDEKEIIDELIGYEIDTTKTGKTTYNNGKSVDHDDVCIALGLAVLKFKEKEDMGDEPTGDVFEIDIDDDYDNEEGWTSMTNNSFEYNL